MKRILIVLAACMAPALLFAAPGRSDGPWPRPGELPELRPVEAGPYYAAEVVRIQDEMGQRKIGDLDVAALAGVRERLSVAAQKDAYVQSVKLKSLLLPGLGQFETGDTAGGIAFLAADVAVLAGTVLAVYYSLPDDLRFDRLDYLRSPFAAIDNAWNGHSIVDYLPAFGVMVGGMIVDQIIRHWSSENAGRGAVRAIDGGSVQFTPKIGIGFMGFGLAY